MYPEIINFRGSLEERQAIVKAAEIERQTVSEWVRNVVRSDLRQRGLWPPQPPTGQIQVEGVRMR